MLVELGQLQLMQSHPLNEGAGMAGSGSATAATPVTGVGENVALLFVK